MSQKEIVTYLINTDNTLYNDYQIYQGIVKSINNKDKETFINIVHNNINNKNISRKMKKSLKLLLILKNTFLIPLITIITMVLSKVQIMS